RQAGIAIVNGHTGRVTTITAPESGPMARSWMLRFPELFSDASTFDLSFLVRLPPASDDALVVADVLAETGLRGEFEARAHLPSSAGDSLFAPTDPAPLLNRATNVVSVAIPLLDPTEDVRGVLVAPGGAEFKLRWIRGPETGLRWTRVAVGCSRHSSIVRSDPHSANLRGPRRGSDSVRRSAGWRPAGACGCGRAKGRDLHRTDIDGCGWIAAPSRRRCAD